MRRKNGSNGVSTQSSPQGSPQNPPAQQAQPAQIEVMATPPKAAMAVTQGEARAVMTIVPRDLLQVVEKAQKEARFAKGRWYYSWTIRRKDGAPEVVRGPSIRLMLALARLWRNIDVKISVEEEGPDYWVLKAVATDLEQCFSVEALFRQSKNVPGTINMGHDRALDIAFQIGQSKCVRNALAKIIPDWLTQKAMAYAMQAAQEEAAQDKAVADILLDLLSEFKEVGVTQQDIERRLGKSISRITPQELTDLQGILTALREGQTTVYNEFPPETPPPVQQAPNAAKAIAHQKVRDDLVRLAQLHGYTEDDLIAVAQNQGVDLATIDQQGVVRLLNILRGQMV